MVNEKAHNLAEGYTLGHYRILKKIGAGGMGEVYLAEDMRLRRKVALKILSPEIAANLERLRRFEQEAYAASGLNHPNILTIYEFGAENETHFLATEFVEGETLREKLKSDESGLTDALSIAEQIAFALSAAHAAGIVHRDLKPENVMIRADGIIKILDFGLAKLIEKRIAESDAEAETRALVKTNPGIVMGTVAYMSPEQARGKETDARTDIWSLGVVLYEMVTRHLPFTGETTSDVIAAILTREPPLLSQYAREVPTELQRIVGKCLRKNREERYQHIKDLWIDLKDLRQELEFQSKLERSASPNASHIQETKSNAPTQISAKDKLTDAATAAVSTKDLEARAAHPTSSAEYIVGSVKRHKRAAIIALVLFIMALAGIGYGVYELTTKRNKSVPSFASVKLQRLTTTGKATLAAISPDGKLVVHVKREGGRESLWLRQVATTSDTQIVPPSDNRYWGLTFSPDGNYVYYVVAESIFNPLAHTLYQVPTLGGASRKVLDDVTSRVTFSPDGKRFAFIRYTQQGRDELLLMVANADGSGEQKISPDEGRRTYAVTVPSWSPDGKFIALCRRDRPGFFKLIAVSVADGTEKEVGSQFWGYFPLQVAWLADGSGLVLAARERTAGATVQLWYVSYPEGEARKITNDLNDYTSVSVAADSNTLVTVQSDTTANISVAPAANAGSVQQITSGKSEGHGGVSWTADGRIVYDSNASGSNNIWLTDADGKNQRQLTNDAGNNHTPVATPDGRYILFVSERAGTQNIWRMNADGSNQVQLTHGTNEFWVRSTPDSKWAIYTSTDSGKDAVWKVPVEGGERVRITEDDTRAASVSPDMKLFACLHREEKIAAPFRVALYSFDDGRLVHMLDVSQFMASGVGFRWSADGRSLLYIDTRGGISNIWSLPIDGGAPKQLTDFKTDQIFWFDLSPDGKRLAFSRGTVTNDVVLISNFKP